MISVNKLYSSFSRVLVKLVRYLLKYISHLKYNTIMELSDKNLYQKQKQLSELKRETYEKLFNRCKNTIKRTADAGELLCVFEIPSFMFGSGYPIINVESCANYIMEKLTMANPNIRSQFISPNIIFIDWRKLE